ncbi:MAG: NAD(P)H-hydrate dehydratase [Pseudomonadota bacterium]|nr:NAD(P)H-hydrate dehydratase [Pseudomonadota bacterium]
MIVRTRPISRATTIRALDRRLIDGVGIPSALLMDHAAHLVADAIRARFPDARRVVVLVGPGNNGGDGYAAARHLAIAGVAVRVVPVMAARSPECVLHAGIAERLGLVAPVPQVWATLFDGAPPDLYVDAIFGTGQRAPVEVPALPPMGAPLVALDVPTGIDADTGARVGAFPAADHVVTIGRLKPFLYVDVVPWDLVDIGAELVAADVEGAPEAVLVQSLTPTPFGRNESKWSRGHVGVYAGSPEMAGAGALAARGALRAGAGLVTLLVPKEAWSRLGTLPPEVMVRERGDLERYDALVLGPGLGRGADAEVRRIWAELAIPCVFDADGLNALDGTPSAHLRLITPHAGEAARLLGNPWRTLEADRLATAARLRAIAPAIYKGACPIVTGAPLRVVEGGLPQMATGGSGDVLSGVCGALLARLRPQDRDGVEAVALEAAWLHQRAGALAGPVGIGAADIADALPRAR